MVQHFHRKVIAGVAALSIAITAVGAGTASAQTLNHGGQQRNYGAEQTIAAILGLAVVGAIVAKNRKDKKRDRAAMQQHAPQYAPAPAPKVHHKRHPVPAHKRPHHAQRLALPAQCLRAFHTDRGVARLFGQRCMHKTYRATARLPHHCHREVWTHRGYRAGWSARCLKHKGFHVARY